MEQTYDFLRISSASEHVLLVELNRPPVNVFNTKMFNEFSDLFTSLADGSFSLKEESANDIRCIILAFALANIFTGGIDHETLASISPSSTTDPSRIGVAIHDSIVSLQRTLTLLTSTNLRIPVIAAVHGQCIGLGIDILAACDVRLAAEGSSFCIKEPALSLVPDLGTLARLPHLVSNGSLLAELTYTARPFDATEARELGLISRVVPISSTSQPREKGDDTAKKAVLKEALSVAEQIAKISPIAIAGVKKILGVGKERSVAENLEYVASWNAFALQTPDIQKAIWGIKTKSPPTFDPIYAQNPKSKL